MSFAHFTPAGEYNEFREHELRKRRLVLVDGNLMVNDSSHLKGQSARAYQHGYWGFASATQPTGADKLGNIALANAKAFSGVIKNSFLLENGERTKALSETMITGNVAQMLKDIQTISTEVSDLGGAQLPWLQISGLRFS